MRIPHRNCQDAGQPQGHKRSTASLFLAGKEKPHLSRHRGKYETPGPVVEESRVFARRVLQAAGDPSHEGDGRFAQPSHPLNDEGKRS